MENRSKKIIENRFKFGLLTSELFLLGILIVLINDIFLKYAYSNVITGKLSDFAGLFIFPFFVSVFFFKHSFKVYISTAVLFVFWKLKISDGFISFLSDVMNFAFYRTVDISDLIALSILPFSYKYFKEKSLEDKKTYFILNSIIATVCFFTILADSQPKQKVDVEIKSEKIYTLPVSKKELYNKLNFNNTGPALLMSDNLVDFNFNILEYNANATASSVIKEDSNGNTIIAIDSISDITLTGKLFFGIKNSDVESCKKLTKNELEGFLKENCIDKLLEDQETKYSVYSVSRRN